MNDILKQLPHELLSLSHQLTADLPQAEVYLAGGAVRDLLLERPTKDYDLVVRGVPADKLENWLERQGKVNLVGKTFGVFKWQPSSWPYEDIDVALPRTEHTLSHSGEYRDFNVQSDPNLPIEQDLQRRDFTINALALNLATGELLDSGGGEADIRAKIIRTVGKAEERLQEDSSRVLRALRLACQLDFTIDKNTWLAITAASELVAVGKINHNWLVPREIIAREFLKSLIATPVKTLDLYSDSGLLKHLLPEIEALKNTPQPEIFHSEGDVYEHTKLALEGLSSPDWHHYFGPSKPSLNVFLGLVLHDIGKPLTLETPETHGVDRIRTHNHEIVGRDLARHLIEQLRLTSYVDNDYGQINSDQVAWLVEKHLLLAHGQVAEFKPSTIHRYFLADEDKGQELLQVIFADIYATRPSDGRNLLLGLDELLRRIKELKKSLPPEGLKLLLGGQEIMTEFDLRPGPKIGQLLEALKEAQLEKRVTTREEAIKYLKEKQNEFLITNS
ncbi:MAG: CCA tRNA nucleotidyltransferase [Candidatus Kerfeldbacteria bacterium]|nr:CCA tRNA nucleotidyltransferase [Candidatus Kerfeldbacteria bacterium]